MNDRQDKSKKRVCLNLEGEININEGALLKERLLNHLAGEKAIEINLKKVTQIDTAGLQILYSAQQTAIQNGMTFSLKHPSSSFIQAANLAGLTMQEEDGYLTSAHTKID